MTRRTDGLGWGRLVLMALLNPSWLRHKIKCRHSAGPHCSACDSATYLGD